MSGYGAGIRRGEMAGDRFTQIANALFRDRRISFKAKGIFGLISTHRDGWRVTVAELARCGPEGRGAVTTGLEELEKHGYLKRERERRENGTLGDAVYAITDVPAHLYDLLGDSAPTGAEIAQKGRSQPESENPALADPAQADRHTKNTKNKKTREQNTKSVHPSVRNACAREADVPDSGPTRKTAGQKRGPAKRGSATATAGVQLLLAIGADHPELLLTGQALADQGHVVQDLLHDGWTQEQIRHVVAARPLPQPLHHTVGAVIAGRLRAAHATPAPNHAAARQSVVPQASSTDAAGWTVAEALTHRALVECTGCGSPNRGPDQLLCPTCLGWPFCTTCTGPTPRRADPDGDGRCTICAT